MKRFISIALSVLLAMAPVSAFAIDVRIDNTSLTMDVPASSINGRTMVPMRAIFEALGADITWDASTKGITATK
ncbi:MAG: copper amine oxidase N-terminal domain-containing protein, partial [Anaerotignum sp.]|nr:copper amine oxidase N-terminal domain-containing protein [Anaerotignum sp.]